MIHGRTVLIIDELNDNREVLRSVLESIGLRTVEAKRPSQGLELARRHRPDLVVLDLEGSDAAPASSFNSADDGEWEHIPMVLLGRATISKQPGGAATRKPERHYLRKPFQYGELIEAIEQLLSSQEPAPLARIGSGEVCDHTIGG